eukprot:gnl/TRDRNA2_/TRDRNA2_76063_c0_seq1.p1 gnl/TRDRNA2_/TRDRNA2_76063_c0~~gnl/TRDRNA2_/TRDRNA2_76063_c0_seq1.p1  ORF type:complete len:103 (-),score=25.38 gnl/TRDRNA2_/TRDRNA2_76063_c0_seq1:168-476(-)
MLKTLAIGILLLFVTISLQGCGCDTEEAMKCSKEATGGEECAAMQKRFDCIADCCDEKLIDLQENPDEATKTAMGDKTVKTAATETVTSMKDVCPDLTDVCA